MNIQSECMFVSATVCTFIASRLCRKLLQKNNILSHSNSAVLTSPSERILYFLYKNKLLSLKNFLAKKWSDETSISYRYKILSLTVC